MVTVFDDKGDELDRRWPERGDDLWVHPDTTHTVVCTRVTIETLGDDGQYRRRVWTEHDGSLCEWDEGVIDPAMCGSTATHVATYVDPDGDPHQLALCTRHAAATRDALADLGVDEVTITRRLVDQLSALLGSGEVTT